MPVARRAQGALAPPPPLPEPPELDELEDELLELDELVEVTVSGSAVHVLEPMRLVAVKE